MTMSNAGWSLLTSVSFSKQDRFKVIANNLTEDRVIIQCSSLMAKEEWFKAGYLSTKFNISGFESVAGESYLMGLQNNIIFPQQELVPYSLVFSKVAYIPTMQVRVFVPI